MVKPTISGNTVDRRDQVLIAPEAAQQEAQGPSKGLAMVAGLAWPGLKRKLDRDLPGYDS